MTAPDPDIDAAAALVGLRLTPDQRPGVLRFLALAQAMAATLDAVPLHEDALDLAPAYRLPEPDA